MWGYWEFWGQIFAYIFFRKLIDNLSPRIGYGITGWFPLFWPLVFCENGLCWWSSNFADVAGYSRKKVGCFAFHFFCEYPVVAEKCGKSSIFHISCGCIAVFEVMRSCCRFGISLCKNKKKPRTSGAFWIINCGEWFRGYLRRFREYDWERRYTLCQGILLSSKPAGIAAA